MEIDKLAWLYINDKKLLTVRSKNKSLFYIPGGKREDGETDIQALTREIKEELSVDLTVPTIQYAGKFVAPADGKININVALTCYFSAFEGQLKPDEEIEEFRYLTLEQKALCSVATIEVMQWAESQGLL